MNRNSLILCLKEYLSDEKEGNCVLLHFSDGSELLVEKVPKFHDTMMSVRLESDYDGEKIIEYCYIEYSSILYITVTSIKNLNVIFDYHNKPLKSEYMEKG